MGLIFSRIDENYSALIAAVSIGDVDKLDKILKKNPCLNPGSERNLPIRLASRRGHLSVIERLLKDPRVNPGDADNLAIGLAAQHGHMLSVCRLLQDERVDPTANEGYAMSFAAFGGHLAVVECLLEDGRADPSMRHNDAFISAAFAGHVAVIKRLAKDLRVNPFDQHNLALRWAVLNKHEPVIRCILKLLCKTLINTLSLETLDFKGNGAVDLDTRIYEASIVSGLTEAQKTYVCDNIKRYLLLKDSNSLVRKKSAFVDVAM